MHIPSHFTAGESAIHELLDRHGIADLITTTSQGLVATPLPLVFDRAAGERGALLGHLARNNEQWRQPVLGEAMAIVRGPDAYVTPQWYPTKAEHGRVVPTWNYITAHVYGELRVHDDPTWLSVLLRRLTDKHEAGTGRPWSVDDAPAAFITGQLRAIVGVELRISRIEAKFKLSQNRPADIDGIERGLRERGDQRMAAAVAAFSPVR